MYSPLISFCSFIQARRSGIVCFYVMYVLRYIYYLLAERNFMKAYLRMPEEKEAFAKEHLPLTPEERKDLGLSEDWEGASRYDSDEDFVLIKKEKKQKKKKGRKQSKGMMARRKGK